MMVSLTNCIRPFESTLATFSEMVSTVLSTGAVIKSQEEANIRLLPKKPDASQVEDFCPTSVLNVDYKIMAAVIARMIGKSLQSVTGSDQKGGLLGRSLSQNLLLYRDVIQHLENYSQPNRWGSGRTGAVGVIIGIDLEKAYDRTDRNILWTIMREMEFSVKLIKWLSAFYVGENAFIFNGNYIGSRVVGITCLRQGFPLSMPLFVICLEPLLVFLNFRLTGIFLPASRVKIRALVMISQCLFHQRRM